MRHDPVDVVRRLGGRGRTGVVVRYSGRRDLDAAVASGRLLRPRRGVLVLPELPDAAVLAAQVGGVVSHASAAAWWRLAMVTPPDVVHVTLARGSRRTVVDGVRHHWSAQPVDPADRVTDVRRTVLDCAAVLPFDEALAVADSALALGLVRRDELVADAVAAPRTGRGRRLRVMQFADGRAANAFESRLRALVLDAGLTGFEPQLKIALPGRVVRVDLADPERRVVLEADSFEHHGTRAALARDCERYDELVAEGWRVLRFAWEHVMFRGTWVSDVASRTCARRPPNAASSPAGRAAHTQA